MTWGRPCALKPLRCAWPELASRSGEAPSARLWPAARLARPRLLRPRHRRRRIRTRAGAPFAGDAAVSAKACHLAYRRSDAPERLALANHGRDQIAAEVVRQVAPVGGVEDDEIGLIARRQAANQRGA